MPAYAFACPDCGAEFETRRSISQAGDPVACPACGGAKAQQQVVAPEFFTRGGWKSAGSSPAPASAATHPVGCTCPVHGGAAAAIKPAPTRADSGQTESR
ncbi:MAG: zinc ribbon domain-containing protein [Bryobacteraceae bacterium]|nr:zinc ribbon domain-containing protein [Bryobacteraceae bacterium]